MVQHFVRGDAEQSSSSITENLKPSIERHTVEVNLTLQLKDTMVYQTSQKMATESIFERKMFPETWWAVYSSNGPKICSADLLYQEARLPLMHSAHDLGVQNPIAHS